MEDCKFKQLILDVYKEWDNPKRIFIKKDFGITATYKNFWGTIYGAIARDTFDEIKDINKYMDICNPNMFLLNSRVTRQEIEIYDYQLENYKINGDKLFLQLKESKNKDMIFEL